MGVADAFSTLPLKNFSVFFRTAIAVITILSAFGIPVQAIVVALGFVAVFPFNNVIVPVERILTPERPFAATKGPLPLERPLLACGKCETAGLAGHHHFLRQLHGACRPGPLKVSCLDAVNW